MFNKKDIQQVADLLIRKKQSLAVAESVTGGFLQAAFSTAENASLFFEGGITAYNITQKYTHLHINLANAASTNCVSEQTAKEMAIAIAHQFSSDWGISITGYASPVPGHHMDDLYAWYAITFGDMHVFSGTIITPIANAAEVQINYTNKIISEFLKQLVLANQVV